MRLEILWMDLRRSQNFTFQKMLTFQLFSQYNTSVKGIPINKWLVSQTVLLGGGGSIFFSGGLPSVVVMVRSEQKLGTASMVRMAKSYFMLEFYTGLGGPLTPPLRNDSTLVVFERPPYEKELKKKSELLVDKCGSNALTSGNLTFGKGNLSFSLKAKKPF